MATNFPNGIDTFVNPTTSSYLNEPNVKHADQHTNANDAIIALENRLGTSGSNNPSTIDYELHNVDHGHNHDGINSRAIDFDYKKILFLADNGPFESFSPSPMFLSHSYAKGTPFISSSVWYTNSLKSEKIFEINYNKRNSLKQVEEIIYVVYQDDGINIKTKMKDIVTYSGPFEINRTRTII